MVVTGISLSVVGLLELVSPQGSSGQESQRQDLQPAYHLPVTIQGCNLFVAALLFFKETMSYTTAGT